MSSIVKPFPTQYCKSKIMWFNCFSKFEHSFPTRFPFTVLAVYQVLLQMKECGNERLPNIIIIYIIIHDYDKINLKQWITNVYTLYITRPTTHLLLSVHFNNFNFLKTETFRIGSRFDTSDKVRKQSSKHVANHEIDKLDEFDSSHG